ncbi:hypothetical protein FGG08_004334 [Glutinoglossum americanum]|uniref:Uncharacterized protein n=1 Tax=Glutinoglossum americanum TaxID=1670608 RepID=A0A9P8I0T8_9PEZI|nr:hypothetical protein FGG08_004334 [Glutinoglossum americanum]
MATLDGSCSGSTKRAEYLQRLEVPTAEKMEQIAEEQERNEEAIKEAKYRHIIQPMPKHARGNDSVNSVGHPAVGHETYKRSSGDSEAREVWKRAAEIARRAGHDDEVSPDEDEEELTEEQRDARKREKQEETAALKKHAKMMDLQYFLEMVDRESHRYGSNLRAYHQEWKKADTTENFFYWLDYGEGKQISLSSCPRDRLDREQVRYLSREERLDYLVKIDNEGRLCWAKNGARINTSERYKDSIHGIVPAGDTAPAYPPEATATRERPQTPSSHSSVSPSSSSSSSTSSSSSHERNPYASDQLSQAKGLSKVRQVSAATIFNRLLRKTVRRNTWIFVHTINNSGHYRPPASNFRSFIHMLKASGTDMSRVSISKSYAVLVGLEAYTRTRRKIKSVYQSVHTRTDSVLHPKATAGKEKEERSQNVGKKQGFSEKQEDEEKASILSALQKSHTHPQTIRHEIHPKEQTGESKAPDGGEGRSTT